MGRRVSGGGVGEEAQPGDPPWVKSLAASLELHSKHKKNPGPDEAAPGHPGSEHRRPPSPLCSEPPRPRSLRDWALPQLTCPQVGRAPSSPILALVPLPVFSCLGGGGVKSGFAGTALPSRRPLTGGAAGIRGTNESSGIGPGRTQDASGQESSIWLPPQAR